MFVLGEGQPGEELPGVGHGHAGDLVDRLAADAHAAGLGAQAGPRTVRTDHVPAEGVEPLPVGLALRSLVVLLQQP